LKPTPRIRTASAKSICGVNFNGIIEAIPLLLESGTSSSALSQI